VNILVNRIQKLEKKIAKLEERQGLVSGDQTKSKPRIRTRQWFSQGDGI